MATIIPGSGGSGGTVSGGVNRIAVVQTGYYELDTGDHNPVLMEVAYATDGTEASRTLVYLDNGVRTVANTVGANSADQKNQLLGTLELDVFADGGDLSLSTADIIASIKAEAANKLKTTVARNVSDGTTTRAFDDLVALDYVSGIEVVLKPVGGHAQWDGAKVTTTAADANITYNGGKSDIDPSGKRATGPENLSGFRLPLDFTDLTLVSGSAAVVTIEFASVPA